MLFIYVMEITFDCVFHQHGDGHGAHAAGDGGDVAGDLLDVFEIDASPHFPLLVAVEPDINDNGAWFDHISRY